MYKSYFETAYKHLKGCFVKSSMSHHGSFGKDGNSVFLLLCMLSKNIRRDVTDCLVFEGGEDLHEVYVQGVVNFFVEAMDKREGQC